MKIVIMAGGSGTRLWPLSTSKKPKQFHQLVSEQHTMLQMSVARLLTHFTIDQIYISTNHKYVDEVCMQLPDIPIDQIIIEPEKRDTAPAIGFASVMIDADPGESIAFLTSDHFIQSPEVLCSNLMIADQFLQEEDPQYIITLGIQPGYPETGYGYIRYTNTCLYAKEDVGMYEVQAFVEKPDYETAKRYLEEGNYVWNSGMFIVRKDYLLAQFEALLPQTAKILYRIQDIKHQVSITELAELYRGMEAISMDYGIMERTPRIAVLPTDMGWNDIGSWGAIESLHKHIVNDSSLHLNVGKHHHVDLDSQQVMIHSHSDKKIIATIGLEDIIIVDTPEVLLVCHKNKSQEVKKIVQLLQEANQTEHI